MLPPNYFFSKDPVNISNGLAIARASIGVDELLTSVTPQRMCARDRIVDWVHRLITSAYLTSLGPCYWFWINYSIILQQLWRSIFVNTSILNKTSLVNNILRTKADRLYKRAHVQKTIRDPTCFAAIIYIIQSSVNNIIKQSRKERNLILSCRAYQSKHNFSNWNVQ